MALLVRLMSTPWSCLWVQERALEEVLEDMRRPHPMLRWEGGRGRGQVWEKKEKGAIEK